jgi:carboxypeptidase C (cathepsin A)
MIGGAMPARCLVLLAASLVVARPTFAQEQPKAAPRPVEREEAISRADGVVTIAGKKVEYESNAGRLPLTDRAGNTTANLFFVAYTKKGVAEPGVRPLTFCFNGGPGASAVWLHLGAFGPRRVRMAEDGKSVPAPTRLVENEWSLLDRTDLVFIDPVSTGYSRAVDPKEAKKFHGVEEDVRSVAEFIRVYTARYGRAASPKYLAGESYGTVRAVALLAHLRDAGVRPAGILLVSACLDFQTLQFDEGNDSPYPLFLPTYTATAWHHRKLAKSPGDLAAVLEESRRFAEGEYAQALRQGTRLDEADRRAVAKKLARLTGLSEEFVLRADLRVSAKRFRRELLNDRGLSVGRYDSRITGRGRGNDPSYTAIRPAFTEAMNGYVRSGLKVETGLKYEITTPGVHPWNYGEAGTNRYLNVAPRLRAAMEKDRSLRVFVANGYYDLATPFAATQFTFAHLGPPSLAGRVTMAYYEAGHMMYTHQPSLKKLGADIAKFMDGRDARPIPLAE